MYSLALARRQPIVVSAVVTALVVFPAVARAASLDLVGQNALGGGGLNGQVATVGNTAVVASGILSAGGTRTGFYNGTYTCPATTVKIVDVSSPSAPAVRAQIPVAAGVAANDVAALRVNTPSFSGDLLAIALVECNAAGSATERGVAYYNITTPATPVFLGRYQANANRTRASDPPCGTVSTPPTNRDNSRCATAQDQVALVQRPDGKVLSLSTQPFAAASQGAAPDPEAPHGDLRVVDITNPTTPTEIGSYPNQFPAPDQRPAGFNGQPNGYSNNGCRAFDSAIGVGSSPDGSRALLPFLDQGLLTVNLANPAAPAGLGQYQYPRTERTFEGNATHVGFTTSGGRSLALLGESDWNAPNSSLRIDGTSSVAGSKFACEAVFTLFDPKDTAQVYRKPGSQVPGGIVYVGRGCPGDPFPAGVDPRGKIAFRDRNPVASRQGPGGTFCGVSASVKRLQDDGAIGVVVGNTSTAIPQIPGFDGDPTGLTIPASGIDTADANALRDVLCPAPSTAPTDNTVVCGSGGTSLSGAMVDRPGGWGALRVVDITDPAAPLLRGVYQPPAAKVFPPPDLGVYAVDQAVARGSTVFLAGHANGVRVLDLTTADPTELASFVPPDKPDPTNQIPGKANVTGVDVAANGAVVVSDTNSGLYVLAFRPDPPAQPPVGTMPLGPPAVVPKPPAPPMKTPARRRGKLSARVTPTADQRGPFRFRISGRLTLPTGITRSVGCKGRVSVQIKRGSATLSTRRVTLAKDCSYSARVVFANARRFARAKRLKFTVRFLGNTRVSLTTATARYARVRR